MNSAVAAENEEGWMQTSEQMYSRMHGDIAPVNRKDKQYEQHQEQHQ